MEFILYTQINALCMVLLVPLIFSIRKENICKQLRTLLITSLIFILLFIITDLLCYYSLINLIALPYTLKYSIYVINYIASGVSAFAWLLYSEQIQSSTLLRKKPFYIIAALPLLLLVILTFTPNLMFSLSLEDGYKKGPLFLLKFILPCLYLAYSSLKALILSCNRKNYAYKNEYLGLASFILAPLSCVILEIFIPNTPISVIGMCIVAIQVYKKQQTLLVSIDSLTGLNNRYEMTRFLLNKVNHADKERGLYLLIADIDYFKKINDQYGHLEGDKALKLIALALKEVANQYNCFVSRFGGDEFIIILEADKSDFTVEQLGVAINAVVTTKAKDANLKYSLKLSIGYSKYNSSMENILDLINDADSKLYEIKRERK